MARYTHVVDAKGRIVLPAKLRERLGASVYITRSLDRGYLSIYAVDTFQSIRAQLNQLPGTDPVARRLRREIIGEALLVEMDKQGRLSVSGELWQSIEAISGESICLIDLDDSIQLCKESFYQEELAKEIPLDALDLDQYAIRGIL